MDRLLVAGVLAAIVGLYLAGPYLIYAVLDILMAKASVRLRHHDRTTR